jgi:GxxExxY protein
MDINSLTDKIIGAAITVHKELGPGLLESVYLNCLVAELESSKVSVRKEVALPVLYRGRKVSDEGFRLDLLVEDLLIVELKSVEKIQPVHAKQLLTYLRLANKPLGLLINFNVPMLKDGITRISNGYGL